MILMKYGYMKKEIYDCYLKNSEELNLLLLAPIRRTAKSLPKSDANIQTIFRLSNNSEYFL